MPTVMHNFYNNNFVNVNITQCYIEIYEITYNPNNESHMHILPII